MSCPARHRQGGAAGDVALRGYLRASSCSYRAHHVASGNIFVFPNTTVVPLCTRSDLERARLGRYVHPRYIESQRVLALGMLTCMKKGLDLLAEHKGINLFFGDHSR